ncbi:AAA family ATPase [Vibrio parahaemolyticus]|uniref:AAA family ATPase n=1 Tax=Vibrio parahaemolyticus TaxID=670 RepID=UPI000A39686F|nr:AAA family ATPase [Vibrio parahaemolyticus]EJE4673996.1 AAA family ATPase [Vibrio parahaemolyticus]EJG1571531.1 AAA family ATPase [Vibrio parahaemolyticus]ELA9371412.1 AAA family ATPase [Vibrio parahaemolyticus]OUJ49003.1 phage infection protein [Vibrio parahaemolyticus]HAS6571979.1 AAA family ATPase [Vibrio parahaemolyticus]
MNKLMVSMTNCYGIRSLSQEFDFTQARANLIYAPNGVMKTSLSNTFSKLSNGQEPEEKLYNRQPTYEVTIDGDPIKQDEILVIEPFNPSFDAKNLSTLLVNADKKQRYDSLYKSILDAKKSLIIELNKLSKIKKDDIESLLCVDVGFDDIFESIRWLQSSELANTDYRELQYKQIFDEKVISLLSEEDVLESIAEYIRRYNELVSNSSLFKTGVFNPSKATTISSSLKKESFFEADHKVILNGREDVIDNHQEFDEVFEAEKTELLSDERLRNINQKLLTGVASVKTFQTILEAHPELAVDLADVGLFKKIIWCTYYSEKKERFDSLLSLFDENKEELESIENEAKLEETIWYEAAETFKERFHVPFSLDIEDHTNTILGTKAPNIVFNFTNDNGENVQFNRGQLTSLDVLPIGERRAMYLLYVIFEFKARQARGQRTIIIVDDIADSFDYKNKYAIIEYLKEIAEEELFRMLVLTHNFDFYRTFQSRVLTERSKRSTSYIVQKELDESISLLKGGDNYVSSPFDVWRRNFSNNPSIIVAMIPFVRNLIEYKEGTSSDDYMLLTSLLHIKDNTRDLRLSHLETVIASSINNTSFSSDIDKDKLVLDFIYETANNLCTNPVIDEIRLENKVTLSVGIRLKAEEFLWSKISNKSAIRGVQTGILYDRYISEFGTSTEVKEIKSILGQVILMTPENIHINSFMYEPLMDLSVHHLVDLYRAVSNLVP